MSFGKEHSPDWFDARSGLFQRTSPPQPPSRLGTLASSLAFGGGGSGLSHDATKAVASVLTFEYMGAAEYEFGEARKCLYFLVEHAADLEATEDGGFFFLTHKNHTAQAHQLWRDVRAGKVRPHEPIRLDHGPTDGWFDFGNGYFVSRLAERRDALRDLVCGQPA